MATASPQPERPRSQPESLEQNAPYTGNSFQEQQSPPHQGICLLNIKLCCYNNTCLDPEKLKGMTLGEEVIFLKIFLTVDVTVFLLCHLELQGKYTNVIFY